MNWHSGEPFYSPQCFSALTHFGHRYQTGYAGVVKDSEAATTLWNEMIDRCDSESSWRGLAFAALVAQIPYWQTPQIFKPANQRPAYYKEDGSIGFAETPMPFTMDRMDEIMGADWREELVLAAQRADEAARLGYGETPAVWNVAVFAHPYRAHFDLEGHKHLWNTFEERWSRIAGGNEKWSQDKSKVSPYHCANDACPNSTKHRTDYKKCEWSLPSCCSVLKSANQVGVNVKIPSNQRERLTTQKQHADG